MLAEWTDVKNLAVSKNLSIQYTIIGSNYWIKATDGIFELECLLPTNTALSADSLDFVNNFKNNGNQPVSQSTLVQSTPPYGAKTIVINGVVKKLYARFTGQQYTVTQGSNTLTYTATYTWAKILGLEVVGSETLDTADLKVYDDANGTYSGHPNLLLNQFSYTLNLSKDFYSRMAQFDADIYAGMVIQITYSSQSAKTIGINFLINEVK